MKNTMIFTNNARDLYSKKALEPKQGFRFAYTFWIERKSL